MRQMYWMFFVLNILVFLFLLMFTFPTRLRFTFMTKITGVSTRTYMITTPFNLQMFCNTTYRYSTGPIEVKSKVPTWQQLEERFTMLEPGGSYRPSNCRAITHLAVIVPYRDRENHLKLFLQHMHPFLQEQKLDYTIYVVEQDVNFLFNKALLMNVGFIMGSKLNNDTNCFVFHDIDMLPMHSGINYTCSSKAVLHKAANVKQFGYHLPYYNYLGGALFFPKNLFIKADGFSNLYNGWGGEDDDMWFRMKKKKIKILRPVSKHHRYISWTHPRNKSTQPKNKEILLSAIKNGSGEGVRNTTAMYTLLKFEKKPLFTWILISMDVNRTLVKNTTQNTLTQDPSLQTTNKDLKIAAENRSIAVDLTYKNLTKT